MLAIACGLYVVRSRERALESSVLAMLPEDEQDPALHELTQLLSGRAARTLLILVGHPEREAALAAARATESELSECGEFSAVVGAFDTEKERAFFDLYFPWRYQMLSPRMRARLEQGARPRELVQRVRELLQSPMSALYTGTLERDPLLLEADLMRSWADLSVGGIATDGFLTVEDDSMTYAILAAETASDPFDAGGGREALDRIERLRSTLASRFAGSRVIFTGALRFGAHTREAMQRDLWVIGIGSMLGTALCILAVFRSLRPFVLSFLPMGVGIAAAALVCFLIFDHVHILTLVFGTSLTGMGVDYALHYFSAHRMAGSAWNAERGMRAVLPGITLGVVTSVVGFSGLYLTHFPVLRQFAVFSSVGLVAAWATVVCWFPLFLASPSRVSSVPWLHRMGGSFLAWWARWRTRRSARVVLACLCCAALCATVFVRFVDDVREFQSVPASLVAEDRLARRLSGRTDDSRFVLVEGANEEETLERLEHAAAVLHGAVDSNLLEGFRDLSRFLPSRARQLEDHALLARALLPEFDKLAAGLDELGFDSAVIEELRSSLREEPKGVLDVDTWLASSASEFLRPMWSGRTERGFAATLFLSGVRDAPAIERLLSGRPGVHYVDRVRDLSELLRRYRIDTERLVVIAYAGVLLALMWRFGIAGGLRAMLPSLLAAGLTLGLLAVSGASLNLFHLLGLLLVLGLAVDYGVFLAEDSASEVTTMFALTLSVITTVMAFGLMISSSAPPLRSLGASVSLGIVLALVFSPLALSRPSVKPSPAST